MHKHRPKPSSSIHHMGIALILTVLTLFVLRVDAAPFTNHFNALIADMLSRAAALSNSTDKVAKKQFKSLTSAIKTLDGKTSTSLATDIKNLGKVGKTLVKAFPTDFTAGGSLQTNLETALSGLTADVQSMINATQTILDSLADSSCKTKAQATLTKAQASLNAASASADFSTASKLLGAALKSELKANTATVKCGGHASGGGSSSGGGGTGVGGSISATVSGAIKANFSTSGSSSFVVTAQYEPVNIIKITGGDSAFNSINVIVDNVTGAGTYPIEFSSSYNQTTPLATSIGAVGSITFSTVDFANQKLVGSFGFNVAQQLGGSGSINVSGGQFNITSINTTPVAVPMTTNFMTAADNGFSFWGTSSGLLVPAPPPPAGPGGAELIISGQNDFLTLRYITFVVLNPTTVGVPYPIADGSHYDCSQNIDGHVATTVNTNNPSGTVVFSALNLAQGIAEGTFTMSVGQSTPPDSTNIFSIVNGRFKNNNITN